MSFYGIALLAVLLDQLSKWAVVRHFPAGPVLGDVLRITVTHNTGAAFGLFPGARTPFLIATLLAAAVLVYAHHVLPAADRGRRVPMAFILGGSLGNLVDRVRLGWVVDFIDVGLGDWRWPTFNAADIAVVLGAVSLGLSIGWGWRREHRAAAVAASRHRGGGGAGAGAP